MFDCFIRHAGADMLRDVMSALRLRCRRCRHFEILMLRFISDSVYAAAGAARRYARAPLLCHAADAEMPLSMPLLFSFFIRRCFGSARNAPCRFRR